MDREIASVDSYKLMAERGLEYGPCFQGLGKLDRGIRESLGQVSLHPSVEQELEKYQLHPALGDALLQSIAGTVPPEEEASGASFLPIGVRRVRVLGELTDDMLAYAARTTEMSDSPDQIQADVRLVDSNGRVLAELIGVVLQRMARTVDTELPEQITDWMYQVEWQPQTLTKNARSTLTGTFLVFIEDDESETALTQAIQSAGGRAVRVQAGEQFLRRGQGFVYYSTHCWRRLRTTYERSARGGRSRMFGHDPRMGIKPDPLGDLGGWLGRAPSTRRGKRPAAFPARGPDTVSKSRRRFG